MLALQSELTSLPGAPLFLPHPIPLWLLLLLLGNGPPTTGNLLLLVLLQKDFGSGRSGSISEVVLLEDLAALPAAVVVDSDFVKAVALPSCNQKMAVMPVLQVSG